MTLDGVLIALTAALILTGLTMLVWLRRVRRVKNADPAARYRRSIRHLQARRATTATDEPPDDIWSVGTTSASGKKKAGAALTAGLIACGGCGGCGCGG